MQKKKMKAFFAHRTNRKQAQYNQKNVWRDSDKRMTN